MDIEIHYSQETILFGRQVRKIRKFHGLTQLRLSNLSSLTQSEISLIENGASNFVFYTLIKVAYGLNVPTIELFDYAKEHSFHHAQKYELNIRFGKEKKAFGNRIENLIKHKKTTQEDVAISAGIDPGDFSRFLNGDHNIEFINIVKIAVGLEEEVKNLFAY